MSYHLEFEKVANVTEKAICFVVENEDGERESVWIPINQIEDDYFDYEKGDGAGSVMISDWIAKQKELP